MVSRKPKQINENIEKDQTCRSGSWMLRGLKEGGQKAQTSLR